MQLTCDNPEFRYVIRAVGSDGIVVNERELARSFFLTPAELVEDWRPRALDELTPDDLLPLLARKPALVLLGTGPRLRFPPAAVAAACLTRGVGFEAMDNAAAARTFTVLAGEGRNLVAGFLL